MRVVGCFLEFEDRFLILLRHSSKPEGDTWGLPGGKVESGESDQEAIVRELEEETGYKAIVSDLHHIGDYDFASSQGKPFTYVTFKVRLKNAHQVRLEDTAHTAYQWVTPAECYAKANLIIHFDTLLKRAGYIQ